MKKPEGDEPIDDDSSLSEAEIKPEEIKYVIQEYDSKIKFRTLDHVHNFIFLENKNSIIILEPIRLVYLYSFHHNDIIVDFNVAKDNSLVLCSQNKLEIYKLDSPNMSDSQIKIKYELFKSIDVEYLQNLTVSHLCDVIVTINKHRIIKLFDMELNLLKTLNLIVNFIPKEVEMFPLNCFALNYDTKTLQLIKYNLEKISFVYKIRIEENENEYGYGEKPKEYAEKIISFNEKIIFAKEYLKKFDMYINYPDSSIMLVLTQGLNFLILQKFYELDEKTYNLIPNLRTLLYINLSNHSPVINDKYISFSLLYDNENPRLKSNYDEYKNLKSGILDMDPWRSIKNKNTLNEDETEAFLNYNQEKFRNISCDYILFNFQENVLLYKVNGLQSPPFNNPYVDIYTSFNLNDNYENKFTLLKAIKTFDRRYSIFFRDKYDNIRKFILENNIPKSEDKKQIDPDNKINELINVSLKESSYTFTMYKNIKNAKYNHGNRKTFILQKIESDSIVVLITFKLKFFKMIIFEKIDILYINWIKNSNFLIFIYNKAENFYDLKPNIGIIYIYSKYLNKNFNRINQDMINKNFINIDIGNIFKKEIKNIYNIFLDNEYFTKGSEFSEENDQNEEQIIEKNDSDIITFNDVSTFLLIKTEEDLFHCFLKVTANKDKKEKKEYLADFSLNFSMNKNKFKYQENGDSWIKMKYIFNSQEIFYTNFDSKLDIISILKIDKNSKINKIYESVSIGKLLDLIFFFNNYIVYISEFYINTYDITNRTFYRLRNDYIKEEEIKSGQCYIHISFFGVYLRLSLLNKKGIKIIRIPRNKNLNESFSFQFKYQFELGEFNIINYSNKMVIFNESQLEVLDKISDLDQSLLKYSNKNKNYKQLVLLNCNAGSLFDTDTFLDYFLCDNENIIKMILNIFCYEYKMLKFDEMQEKYKNSKLIPNYLASFDFIKKIIFDENFHSKIISNQKFNYLTFNQATDDEKENPIKIMCKKNSNISHMKYVYDLLSDESTKKIDNFTKYFMLKIFYKKKDFENRNFKLSTVDLCWISLISNQSDILNFICHGKVETINWETMTMFNIPLWIKSDAKLKELLVEVAKNHYKQQFIDEAKNINNADSNKIKLRNYTENIALYLYLAGQQKMIIDYFNKEPHNEKIKKFVMRDFSIKKNRNAAHENADTLMNKKKYIYAAYFYLLSDDIRSAIDMVYEKMRDVNLTICMLRLVDSKFGNDSWKKYYSLEKIYKDLFINFGTVFRDPYLVTFGYLGQGKYDLALEYILTYDNEYSFDNNREIFQDIDDYLSNLNILRKSFALNVFDYRMILFAKSLENVYHIKYDESNKTVQNVGNTGFDEDEWDMDNLGGRNDEDEEDEDINDNNKNAEINANKDNADNNSGEYKLKKIEINYDNLIRLCLINSLKQGTIYTPIINLYKTAHKDKITDLPQSIKDILKSLICDRVVLDTINSPNIGGISEQFFSDCDTFFNYLEKEGINNKLNMYKEINYEYCLIHYFKNAYQSSIKSEQVMETLISIHDYIELILNNNIYLLVNFNYFQNVNLEKTEKNLDKIIILLNYLERYEQNYVEPKKEKEILNDLEKNVYIFRIIFMVYFYLLFINKIILKYHYVTIIYSTIIKIVNENYYCLQKFTKEEVTMYIENLYKIIMKIKIKIQGELSKKKKIMFDEGISFYINFMNLAVLQEISKFIEKNQMLKKISYSDLKQMAIKNSDKNDINSKNSLINEKNDHYFYEDFKFIIYLKTLVNSYLDNFDINIEKYISLYMKCDLRYSIHEELKKIYIKKSPIKFSTTGKNIKLIKYEYLYSKKSEEKFFQRFYQFESVFKLGNVICKYITYLSEKFKYEKKIENDPLDVDINPADQSLPPSNYTISSINIVSSVFHKVGYEIFKLNENITINDFCCNYCDMTQMAVSFGSQGNIKINILNNLLNKKKTDSMLSLMEKDVLENWEQNYKNSYVTDYYSLLEKQIQENYNEILSILYHGIYLQRKNFMQFPQFLRLPPQYFNSLPSSEFLQNISTQKYSQPSSKSSTDNQGLNNSNNNLVEVAYSKILLPHPQLPIYLSSNNRDVISVYSFSPYKDVNCPIDEYFIEKNSNAEQSKPHPINKMKFNSYGDTLLCNDSDGSVFTWNFDHTNSRKTPKNIIQQIPGEFCCDDCCFLNNTGIIATTSHKIDEKPKTCLFDLLLPQKQRKIQEIYGGGDRILPVASDASFLVGNKEKPGSISFVDIRKMEVINSFQAHQDGYIKDVKLSQNENFLVTYGDDIVVKIWDLSNKTNPLLIESFQPFEGKTEKKPKNKLQLINGFLFASKDNSIKLLRNNII